MFRKILLCYDGSAEGRRALLQGAELARAINSEVYLLAISRSMIASSVPEGITPELFASEEKTVRALLTEGVAYLKSLGLHADGLLVFGNPMEHIPEVAERVGADLIVVSYRTRGRLARWWSDSEEQMLITRVSCSILVTRAPNP